MLIVGNLVYVPARPEWRVGRVVEVDGRRALTRFAVMPEPVLLSTRDGALLRAHLARGTRIRDEDGRDGTVEREVGARDGLTRYAVAFDDGNSSEVSESRLSVLPPPPDFLDALARGEVEYGDRFLWRRRVLKLDEERRGDALGALLASRVWVKPHQVGTVARVLSRPRPRFILADEVGLGKTIEAGMVFAALRLQGLGKRTLIVAPNHLLAQWLIEMLRKFNARFTLLDAERLRSDGGMATWTQHDAVITSHELLLREGNHLRGAVAADAHWDLVIIDEAHHLASTASHAAASQLAANCWGLLLLTATPLQLGIPEYHALLRLLEPKSAPTLPQFENLMARQGEAASAIREIGSSSSRRATALAKLFPKDERLGSLVGDALVEHLAESYSLSDSLIRNRRATVGGFAPRQLKVHAVRLSAEALALREAALTRIRGDTAVRGAARASLLRRMESSHHAAGLPGDDPKVQALGEALNAIWRDEPGAKVLVFTESVDTVEHLADELLKLRIVALVYRGDVSILERDRRVARFRDPFGPNVLLSTEVGGEGRNFQFSHHLINFDLPWSPAAMEQRIGRLDRLGQTHPVVIHVFDVEGTLSADVLRLLRDAVGVFSEPVGGLDSVFEEVESAVTRLATAPPDSRAAYLDRLTAKVTAAKQQLRDTYDPLLDARSANVNGTRDLLRRAAVRAGLDVRGDGTLEDGLIEIGRDLDERQEECITTIAELMGVATDLEKDVEAFQVVFDFREGMLVDALPGFDTERAGRLLGTFWRDTAVLEEEIDYFTTGHPMVEAFINLVVDGPFGRAGAVGVRGTTSSRGAWYVFRPLWPDEGDVGSRAAARHAARYTDSAMVEVVIEWTASGAREAPAAVRTQLMASEGTALSREELSRSFPDAARFVGEGTTLAVTAAREEWARRVERARGEIARARDIALARLQRNSDFQTAGVDLHGTIRAEEQFYASMTDALDRTLISLDAASLFLVR